MVLAAVLGKSLHKASMQRMLTYCARQVGAFEAMEETITLGQKGKPC